MASNGLSELLLALERELDPVAPAANRFGVEIVDYGEVSALIALAELPGRVLKRMSGFAEGETAAAYASAVERYIALLEADGVPVVPTEVVSVAPAPDRHVVYLVQTRVPAGRLGQGILRRGTDDELCTLIGQVLEHVRRVLGRNGGRADGRSIAIDAQLSNWYWPETAGARPTLLDVGTPFMLLDGRLEIGTDLFLRAYLAPLRWWLRRERAVERYIDDYFHLDLVVLDMLGNFFKEGAAQRLPAALRFVNEWIHGPAGAVSIGRAIDADAVRAYYAKDASTLETSLRARRFTRLVTTTVLRRRYDFILPGRIRR